VASWSWETEEGDREGEGTVRKFDQFGGGGLDRMQSIEKGR